MKKRNKEIKVFIVRQLLGALFKDSVKRTHFFDFFS